MKLKQREFLDLKQGGKSVMEYMQAFNHLAQYAPTHIDTDEKKKDYFLEGLSSKLKLHLGNRFANFHELVDDALTMEDRLRVAGEEEKKKRQISAPSSGFSQRPRLTYQQPQHYVLRPPQLSWNYRPPHQHGVVRPQHLGHRASAGPARGT